MRVLVVYDSKFGNTYKVAESLASGFGEEAQLVHADTLTIDMLQEADVLIVGSPIQRWRPSPTIKVLLDELKADTPAGSKPIKAAAFDTGFASVIAGNAAKKIYKALRKSGFKMLAPPERFIVTGTEGPLMRGELNRASVWGKLLHRNCQREELKAAT